MLRQQRLIPAALLISLIGLQCTKSEISGPTKATPADVDIVATIDVKAILDYAEEILPGLIPAEAKGQIPDLKTLAAQAAQMLGVDIHKLSKLHYFGYLSSEDQMAIIAEGIEVPTEKFKPAGEHQGIAMFSVPPDFFVAKLAGLGVLAAPKQDMLKRVIDVFSGKAKNLAQSERGKLLSQLADNEKQFTLVRAYLLTGQVPNADQIPVKVQGAAAYIDLNQGVAVSILSDPAGADKMVSTINMGLMGLKTSLAMGGDALPFKLDASGKKAITDTLNNIKTEKKENLVTVAYRGDLKPLIAQTIKTALGQASQPSAPVAPAPNPEAPPAVPPAASPATE